jgi:hypothetical protein
MPDSPKRERRFNDEEVALIIKRAAELQQTEQAEQEPGSALSLPEIEEIAHEAGIDQAVVNCAGRGERGEQRIHRRDAERSIRQKAFPLSL